jgi:lysophospholipase L1-like esterase
MANRLSPESGEQRMKTGIWAIAIVAGCLTWIAPLTAQTAPAEPKLTPGNGPDDPRPAPWAISHNKADEPYKGPHGTPATPPPPGLYVAMGDSITYGVGVKVRCSPFPTHPVDVDEFCPDGTSYPVLVARALRAAGIAGHFMNVGIGGAHVDRVIKEEIPYLPAEATLINVYIGTNDSRPGATPKHDAKYVVGLFESQYEDMLKAIHAKAPHARIVLVNFPNEKYLNGSDSTYKIPETALPLYDEISQVLTRFIDAHYPAYGVVDTACNPSSYDWSLQLGQGVHPNEQGAAILAASVLKVVLTAKPAPPPASCKWYSEAVAADFAKSLR